MGERRTMTEQIAPWLSLERPDDDDGATVVAGELLAQLGAEAVDIVERWAADACATYGTPFWRKVIDEIRRTARS
jgi:hypothetical protein